VTLTRLVLAWLPVALEFMVVEATAAGPRWTLTKPGAMWRCLEAAVVTLFASLWFDSLGHGGWWLLFLLVGLMVSLARAPDRSAPSRREALTRSARDTVRYVVAGAILAWRLA
jgi:hypothetical protein